MDRLLVLVEGETEETFVNEVLAPHLYSQRVQSVTARIMGNARLRSRRGGVRGWPEVKQDIVRHLRQDRGAYVTTMVDYYALPHGAGNPKAWPGRTDAQHVQAEKRAALVEDSIGREVRDTMGSSWNPDRFLPFLVMHEFEALLFSDCPGFARGIARANIEAQLVAIRAQFRTPEEIDDSPLTHPAQRVADLVPGYQKPLLGNLAALEIGLGAMRSACPHFAQWLGRLEALASSDNAGR